MEIKTKLESGQILVLELDEENLDASNVREFRDAVHPLIEGRKQVVFDMSKLKFVDSSGLGAMISCQRILKSKQSQFRLCEMTVTVRALFDVMRMNRVFQIHATRAEAIEAFQAEMIA